MATASRSSSPVRAEAIGVQEKPETGAAAGPKPASVSLKKALRDPPCRFIFAFMGFFCFFNLYSLRVNLSVAVVSMINQTHMKELEKADVNATIIRDPVVCDTGNVTAKKVPDGQFDWNSKEKGYLLSSFFYGYIITQLPGGMAAEKYGGKFVLLAGIGTTAVLTVLTPVITEAGGYPWLLVVRVLEGLGQGVAFPAMHVMLSRWAPPLERGRLATFVYAGGQIGTVVTMPVSGALCQKLNWQSVFYVFGAIGIIWSVMWMFLVYDRPATHPRISTDERTYIETSQGSQKVQMKAPWLKMAASPAVYALMFGNLAHNWTNFYIMISMPLFLSSILKFDILGSGLWSGAPYLAMWLAMLLGGSITDLILTRRLMSVTWVRKLFNIIGFVLPAAFMIGIGFIECQTNLAIVLLLLSGFCLGLSWSGWGVNHMDIAAPLAGTLFGITNCISSVPGIVSPLVVGLLTFRNQTRAAWRGAFYLTAAVCLWGAIFFLFFGTGERQKWSYPPGEIAAKDVEAQVLLDSKKKEEEEAKKKEEEEAKKKEEEEARKKEEEEEEAKKKEEEEAKKKEEENVRKEEEALEERRKRRKSRKSTRE